MRGLPGLLPVLLAVAAAGGAALAWADSAETPDLVQRVAGTLAMTEPVGGIIAIDVPSLQRAPLRPPNQGHKAVTGISEPDGAGRVAFVTEGKTPGTWAVHVIGRDGRVQTLFSGDGDPLWDNPLTVPALAPEGGRIAFVAQPSENQGKRYRFLVSGPLKMWDPAAAAVRDLGRAAVGQRPAWFPDGRRLVYVAPVPGSLAAPHVRDARSAGTPLPVVRVLDTNSGQDAALGEGHHPIVSSDGRTVLVERTRREFVLIDVATRAETPLPWLSRLGSPVTLVEGRYVVYRGAPTPGAPTGSTAHNSPLVGPKPMQAVKLGDLQTKRFVTLIPLIDPRARLAALLRLATSAPPR